MKNLPAYSLRPGGLTVPLGLTLTLLVLAALPTRAATVTAFTGGDPGEGLDLQGNFLYAVNVGSNGAPGLIGDAIFTTDTASGVSVTAPSGVLNTLDTWAAPGLGVSVNDTRLTQAMSSIRWTFWPTKLTVTLGNLQAGHNYQLQLLFIETCCDHVFDVALNGAPILPAFRLLDYGPLGTALVITHTFTATNTSALIELGGGAVPPGLDGNPTLSAFTLEDLSPFLRVTTTADSGAGSLRDTLANAANGALVTFAPALNGQTITLASQIVLSNNVTIDGIGLPAGVRVSGGNANRIFWVTGNVTLRNLSLTGGNANGGPVNTFGGAMEVYDLAAAALERCTLSGNTATDGGAIIVRPRAALTLTQCTIANNSVSAFGGGIYHRGAALTLTRCTVSGNSAPSQGGGVYVLAGSFTLTDSIVAQNSASSHPDVNIAASAVTTGVNLIGRLAGSAVGPGPTLLTGNARLAPLGNYGGPTQTMPPMPGSPALDGCVLGSGFLTDQRGFPRPQDNDGDSIATADIGAVEGVHNPAGPGVLTGLTRFPNGSIRFEFTRFNGNGPFTVLATTNLAFPVAQWSVLGTGVEAPVGSGEFLFTDPQASNFPQRFYQVRTP